MLQMCLPTLSNTQEVRSELTLCNDILPHGCHIVVLVLLWKQTLEKIHHGHQGIQKCRLRANSSVWWSRMSDQITEVVKSCPECTKDSFQNHEPMIASSLPNYPWQIIGIDLFQCKGTTYLPVVDQFSRYPKIAKLTDTTSKEYKKRYNQYSPDTRFQKLFDLIMILNTSHKR